MSLCAGILFAAMTLPTFAGQTLELVWTPSESPDIVGYNVYYGGTSDDYTNEISVGNLTSLTVSGLANGATYFFAVTSVNSFGVESDSSAQTTYAVPSEAAIFGIPVFSSNGVSLPVTGLPGHLYVIQTSTNLLNWISLKTNLTPLQFTDTNSVHCNKRFYRAVYLY